MGKSSHLDLGNCFRYYFQSRNALDSVLVHLHIRILPASSSTSFPYVMATSRTNDASLKILHHDAIPRFLR